MNSRLGRVATIAVLSALAVLVVSSVASAQWRQERIRLPYWQLSDGSVQTSSVHRPLMAAPDRLLVGLEQPSGIMLSPLAARRFPRNPGRIADAVGGRIKRFLGGGSLAVVDLPVGSDLYAAADKLRRAGAVFVEPDGEVYLERLPNDPRYPEQHHHPQIKSPAAWDVTIGSRQVVIAVIDSGIDLLHPDLADSIWVNPREIPGNGIDDDKNGYIDDWRGWDFYEGTNNPRPKPDGKDNDGNGEPDDQVSHGTLVAGLAAAIGNDGYGTAGVAWRATIMALKVFPDDGTTSVSTVVEAIDYAVDNGADIINLSIGAPYFESFSDPIARAYQSGIVVVCASGNDGKALTDSSSSWVSPVCNDGPSAADNYVLGVGAVNREDKRTWYTNYDMSSRDYVDVCAPGSELFGPVYYDETGRFPHLSKYFGTNTGTSFAAPLVSGLAALVLTKNPGYRPAQVYAAIRNSADNIDGKNPGYEGTLGTGRINAGRALGQVLPPAKVTDFEAFDTPDDDGGSITLTWTRSADDGGGASSVTGYVVLRREGTTGSFKRVAVLPSGTTRYDDTDVSDGTMYYYIVRATDGSLTSDSPIAGPVTSANDGAPPVVEKLPVVDRPDDDGGAIVLDWSDYTPPGDFAAYRIYRHSRRFTSTAGVGVLVTITNPATKRWVDETVRDGVDYYYAVGVRDVAANEERAVRSVGPVQSYPNRNITFGPGLLFMGPAAVPADRDPATLLSVTPAQLKLARWHPTGSPPYVHYKPGAVPELLKLGLGRGFWVLLDKATVVQPTGAAAPAGDFSIELGPGWHQLANPFFSPLDFGASTVTYGTNTMDLASAERSQVLRSVAWVYSTQAQRYQMAYPDVGQRLSLIPPWSGFWVNVVKPCTLTLVRSTTGEVASAGSSVCGDGWRAPILLRAAGMVDDTGLVGTAETEFCLPAPPPIDDRPQLRLTVANRDEKVAAHAVSLGAGSAGKWTWNLDAQNLPPNSEVELSVPDLSTLPPEYTAILHDPLAGKSVHLRTVSGYRFMTRDETSRRLQLSVEKRAAGVLVIGTLGAQAGAGAGAQVVFSLSQPARTSIEVVNIAGRSVRLIEDDHLRLAGNHTIVFDGRNSHGAAVPGGRYLVIVKAVADDGQQARRMVAFNLSR